MTFFQGFAAYLGIGVLCGAVYPLRVFIVERRYSSRAPISARSFTVRLLMWVFLWPVAMWTGDE